MYYPLLLEFLDKPEEAFHRKNWWGFGDWFCNVDNLPRKAKSLTPKICRLAKSSKLNVNEQIVCLKNIYDGERFRDNIKFVNQETEEVAFSIVVPSRRHLGEVWGHENGFTEPLVVGTMEEIYKFFSV